MGCTPGEPDGTLTTYQAVGERGASLAGLYSLVATCEARGINPF